MGMLYGIVFHQILQWHSAYMHTDYFNQIVSDGVFNIGVTLITFWGATVLWRSNPWSESHSVRRFWSGLFVGAGVFNLFEGIINHHILEIHHVRPGDPNEFYYDLAFDGIGVLVLIIGWSLYRSLKTVRRYRL